MEDLQCYRGLVCGLLWREVNLVEVAEGCQAHMDQLLLRLGLAALLIATFRVVEVSRYQVV